MASEVQPTRDLTREGRVGRVLRSTRPSRVASPIWLVLPALALLLVLLVYPLVLSTARSLTEQNGGTGPYQWLIENPVYLRILLRTFLTAAAVTAICLVLAYPYAYLMTIVSLRWRVLMFVVVLVPFWTSALIRTFAWVVLLQPDGIVSAVLAPVGVSERLLGTQVAVLIGMAQLLLPFMVLPLYASMSRIDLALMRAAESLGARPLVAFARIFLPLSLPGVFAGCLIVCILSLGFYVVPALLGSPSESLIAQTIYQQVSGLLFFGRGGAIAVVLLLATALLLGLAALLTRLLPGAERSHRRG